MTLLAFAAERRAAAPQVLSAGRAAIDRYLLPARRTAENPQQRIGVNAAGVAGVATPNVCPAGAVLC